MKTRIVRRDSGMVLMVVVAVVVMMSIVVIGILSRNVSRALATEKQIRLIEKEILAKGAFWKAYHKDGELPSDFSSGDYNISYEEAEEAGPGGTKEIRVVVQPQ